MKDAYCVPNTIYGKFSTPHVVVAGLVDPTKGGPLDQAEVTVSAWRKRAFPSTPRPRRRQASRLAELWKLGSEHCSLTVKKKKKKRDAFLYI
jgi:hypothetical protein